MSLLGELKIPELADRAAGTPPWTEAARNRLRPGANPDSCFGRVGRGYETSVKVQRSPGIPAWLVKDCGLDR